MAVKFEATKEELDTIRQIADRWRSVASTPRDKLQVMMDIEATHSNGCPLDLKKLLGADALTFVHDMHGIEHHLDRETGKLQHCFLPRTATNQ